MAVTIIRDDLVQPIGLLDDALFLTGTMNNLVDGWIQDAANKTAVNASADPNGAATAWVYYRGYTHIADRLANTPNNMVAGPRTEGYSSDQRTYFANRAEYWLETYYGLTKTVDAAFAMPVSRRVPVQASW